MELDFIQLVIPFLIVSFAAAVQGVTGFGSGLVSMALLPLLWNISHAVGVLSPMGVILTIMLTYKLRAHIQFNEIKYLLLPMPVGILGGIWVLEHWPNTWMKAFLGIILIVYVSSATKFGRMQWAKHPVPAAFAGLLGGIFGAAFSAAGPPILIYASLVGWERDQFRANIQVFFMSTAILGCLGLIKIGLINEQTLPITAICLPGILAGGLLGNHLATKLPQEKFRSLVMAGLFAMGILYLAQWLLS